jgi:hypothetical protein
MPTHIEEIVSLDGYGKDYGRIAYVHFRAHVAGRPELPDWEDLPEGHRHAWTGLAMRLFREASTAVADVKKRQEEAEEEARRAALAEEEERRAAELAEEEAKRAAEEAALRSADDELRAYLGEETPALLAVEDRSRGSAPCGGGLSQHAARTDRGDPMSCVREDPAFTRCTSTATTTDGRLVRCMLRAGGCGTRRGGKVARHLIDSRILGSEEIRENLRPGETLTWELTGDCATDIGAELRAAGPGFLPDGRLPLRRRAHAARCGRRPSHAARRSLAVRRDRSGPRHRRYLGLPVADGVGLDVASFESLRGVRSSGARRCLSGRAARDGPRMTGRGHHGSTCRATCRRGTPAITSTPRRFLGRV